MNNIKFYIQNANEEICEKENKYNMLKEQKTNSHSELNKLCLKQTVDISLCRKKNTETKTMEKNLFDYREYALSSKD
ncbi:MAG: hypothetical protein LBR70_05225 [Lactobacillaceae bacterium]|nr:hypothetical protein [Lactobacillaceae bacterium]